MAEVCNGFIDKSDNIAGEIEKNRNVLARNIDLNNLGEVLQDLSNIVSDANMGFYRKESIDLETTIKLGNVIQTAIEKVAAIDSKRIALDKLSREMGGQTVTEDVYYQKLSEIYNEVKNLITILGDQQNELTRNFKNLLILVREKQNECINSITPRSKSIELTVKPNGSLSEALIGVIPRRNIGQYLQENKHEILRLNKGLRNIDIVEPGKYIFPNIDKYK